MSSKQANFRIQPREHTTVALIDFFNANFEEGISKREAKERAITALSAFWKCYALRLSGNDEHIQRRAAIEGVNQLLEQAEKIIKDFGLERHRFLGEYTAQSFPSNSIPETLTPSSDGTPLSPIQSPWTIDDETLLGDLL